MGYTEFKTPVNEGSSRRYSAQLTSPDGPVTTAVITSILFTLFDPKTGTVINGRDKQEVKNQNGGTLEDDGLFELVLGPADISAIDTTRFQKRRGLLEIAYTNGHENHVIGFTVDNLVRVP